MLCCSDRPNAAKIVRGGIEYAFANPEKRLLFLSQGLVHFTSKLASSDIAALYVLTSLLVPRKQPTKMSKRTNATEKHTVADASLENWTHPLLRTDMVQGGVCGQCEIL